MNRSSRFEDFSFVQTKRDVGRRRAGKSQIVEAGKTRRKCIEYGGNETILDVLG